MDSLLHFICNKHGGKGLSSKHGGKHGGKGLGKRVESFSGGRGSVEVVNGGEKEVMSTTTRESSQSTDKTSMHRDKQLLASGSQSIRTLIRIPFEWLQYEGKVSIQNVQRTSNTQLKLFCLQLIDWNLINLFVVF